MSREHWLMWKSSDRRLYVRAGRFMPVYGLRQPEHVLYTRRYGGTPLYGETYGASVAGCRIGSRLTSPALSTTR